MNLGIRRWFLHPPRENTKYCNWFRFVEDRHIRKTWAPMRKHFFFISVAMNENSVAFSSFTEMEHEIFVHCEKKIRETKQNICVYNTRAIKEPFREQYANKTKKNSLNILWKIVKLSVKCRIMWINAYTWLNFPIASIYRSYLIWIKTTGRELHRTEWTINSRNNRSFVRQQIQRKNILNARKRETQIILPAKSKKLRS